MGRLLEQCMSEFSSGDMEVLESLIASNFEDALMIASLSNSASARNSTPSSPTQCSSLSKPTQPLNQLPPRLPLKTLPKPPRRAASESGSDNNNK
jgi:hypothetical protein